MPRIVNAEALKGSQMRLQHSAIFAPATINDLLRPKLRLGKNDKINWLSPLADDDFAEYQDESFLERLDIRLNRRSLDSFWPQRGPVWDGLAKTSRGDVILVEAKSHISEMVSSCQAGEKAKVLIEKSLAEAKAYCQADTDADWLNGYYQYANRLAHLYLLRELNNIPAWLVFVCFVNDEEMSGPKSIVEWQGAIAEIHRHLGVTRDNLYPHVVDVFPDVKRF